MPRMFSKDPLNVIIRTNSFQKRQYHVSQTVWVSLWGAMQIATTAESFTCVSMELVSSFIAHL